MNTPTADLYDAHFPKVQALDYLGWKDYGAKTHFKGKVKTLKCFEDNSLVRKVLEENGQGKVLVIDGGGSVKHALLGDMLGELAVKNGWEGVIIHGMVRDSAALKKLNLGIKALGTVPAKTEKNNQGLIDVTLRFASVSMESGDFVYADEDGILLSKTELE
ncbi:MAG: ribonuclease E activity regulator RraA [Bacteroidia bacterium]|nr:ribonuclease E activity regulator RraA [Bacteroidia bacterium]